VYDAVNGIQYSYVVKGEPEKAVQLIDEFIGNNPGLSFSDQIFFKKGEIYYSLGRYEEAKVGYKEFVANYPRSELISDAYYWIGKCAQNLNQSEEAIFNFNRVLESYPNSEAAASSVIEIGNVYNNIKNYDAAISTFDKAVKKLSDSPRISEILFMKGETLVNKGDVTGAYEVFDEVIQYYKGTIFADKAKLELGLIELAAKRFENAEFYFKSLAESRTDDLGAKAQYYYGETLFEEEKFSDAITALVRVRSIFPAYNEWVTRSVLKLGDCYVEIEDFDKAKEMYRTVLSAHRGDTLGKEAQEKLNKIR
jgi:TolA-binding protein